MQYQRLAQEMQDAAVAGLIQRRPRIKASRSLPAIVMKPAPKPRVSEGSNKRVKPVCNAQSKHYFLELLKVVCMCKATPEIRTPPLIRTLCMVPAYLCEVYTESYP